jgi:crotonobetainyl-CoA:carnitine CoA-transferase CaiB-like acyl-CoA transferase
VLLFTTQIWSYVERARSDYHEVMSKSYPPGVHQEMVFEVAGGDYVHTCIMSGLKPLKSQDEIIGLDTEASDNTRFAMLSEEERAQLTPRRRAAYRARDGDALIEEFHANNHAVEAIISMEEALGATGRPHPQLVANDMVVTVDDPVLGRTTQVGVPIHLQGTPGGIRGPRPVLGADTDAVFGELGYSEAEIAAISGAGRVPA